MLSTRHVSRPKTTLTVSAVGATRIVLTCFMWLIALHCFAQDQPPEKLADISVHHYTTLVSDYPDPQQDTGYEVVWTDIGFGRYDIDLANPGFRLNTNAPYVLYRITNPSNGAMDDYWMCRDTVWATYETDTNVTTLRAQSNHYQHFNFSSNFVLPPPPVIVTWVKQNDELTYGLDQDGSTIVVLKKTDGSWEWTIRGTSGTDVWTVAATEQDAKDAAQSAIGT